ncbi:MAG TPA: glycosyltransferase family 1 protein [Gaiellaceae bacterium]|nr:glycosyltransferase family 1 protein [Gaiellaceae bacterium]
MRIGVDATSWGNRRGYGRFARNVVSALVSSAANDEYVLFADEWTAGQERLPERARVRVVPLSRPPGEAAAADSQRPLRDLARLSRSASREPLDVFLFPSVYTWFPVLRTPTVVGIHDLIADEYPELTLPSRPARARWLLKRRLAVRTASRIFTVSRASRASVTEALGLPDAEVVVVSEAPDAIFGPRTASQIEDALAPLGLGGGTRYLVYAGGISPHKGLVTLVEAYARLAEPTSRLVLVGALEDETYMSAAAEVRRRISELGLAERVLLTGYVPDETLACLYAGAIAFVSPSLSEGFGLPAVEAARSRTAVLLSDIDAHRETLGDAARYFPAGDAGRLAAELAAVIGDDDLRSRLASAAHERVAGLSWDAAAASLRAVLAEAAG